MNQVTDAEKFLFDIQGYLILPSAIDGSLVAALDRAVVQNEALDHDESWAEGLPIISHQNFIKDHNFDENGKPRDCAGTEHLVRLNGLPRLDPVFDQFIGHPSVIPYIKEFMCEPQLINTWSISKYQGRAATGWHHGLPIEEYTVRNGLIRSPMLNVVTMLTPNHPGDGCFIVIPGSHKKSFNLNPQWRTAGLNTPGAIEITGDPGDVMVFTEALTHAGAAKTTARRRTTLQYNHVHRNRACPMWDHHNARHYWMPPSIRERFNLDQRELTRWMDYTIPDRSVPGSERIDD